jgi:predicted RNase H-like nuclease
MDHTASAVCIGLDLAWSDRNRTGGAVLRNGHLVAWSGRLTSDEAILAFVGEAMPAGNTAVVAIDAPLRVPNETGRRMCDHQVSVAWGRYDAGAYPANRRLLAPAGIVRGEALVAALGARFGCVETAPIPLRGSGRYVCEVFPHPAHVALFALPRILKYKRKPGREHASMLAEFERYRSLLANLASADPPLCGLDELLAIDLNQRRGQGLREVEEALDAVTCAYVAWYAWWHGPTRQQVYGSVEAGHILVPVGTGDRRSEIGDRRLEIGDRRSETGDWRSETKAGYQGAQWPIPISDL